MLEKTAMPKMQIVVSDREEAWIGDAATKQKAERCIYYYAEKGEECGLFIQPLNANFIPAGEKKAVEEGDFLKKYRPEPLIYYNRVKPSVEQLEQKLCKADKLLKEEKLGKAAAAYKDALAIDSENIKAIFGLGITYLSANNIEEATAIFEKIIGIELAFTPQYKHLFNEFGIKMRKCKLFEPALEYYTKAIECSGQEDENLFFNLARIYYEMNNYPEAVLCLQRALGIKPSFTVAERMLHHVEKLMQNQTPAH